MKRLIKVGDTVISNGTGREFIVCAIDEDFVTLWDWGTCSWDSLKMWFRKKRRKSNATAQQPGEELV